MSIGDKKGAPIPIYHPTYGKRYARHPNGQKILTEFEPVTLPIAESAYSEFYYTNLTWPEFTANDLNYALNELSNRSRTFGDVKIKK